MATAQGFAVDAIGAAPANGCMKAAIHCIGQAGFIACLAIAPHAGSAGIAIQRAIFTGSAVSVS